MKSPSPTLVIAALMGFPFLIGFAPRDSSGMHVGLAAGRGAYRYSPACSQKDYDVAYQEVEAYAEHRFRIATDKPAQSFWQTLRPEYLSLGISADASRKEILLAYNHDPDSGERPGARSLDFGYALGGYLDMDWKWLGLAAGVRAMNDSAGSELDRAMLPMAEVRLGGIHTVYASAELFGSSPISSGGGWMIIGIGGRMLGTNWWAGSGFGPHNGGGILKLRRTIGDAALFATALLNPEEPSPPGVDFGLENAVSLGLEYRFDLEKSGPEGRR